MPFARQRLVLGITGVGSTVVLSVVWLLFTQFGVVEFASNWRPLAALPSFLPMDAAIAALVVFLVHALLLAPLEYVGGARVVRQVVSRGEWLAAWSRGVAVHASVFAVVAAATATVALALRPLGAASWAPAFVAVGVTLAFLEFHGPLARVMARLAVRAPSDAEAALATANGIHADRLRIVDVADESFVGGWVGLVLPELWIPARWTTEDQRALLEVQLVRRQSQVTSGARRRGVIRTVLWQGVGLLILVPILPWELTEARTYLVLPAVASLWSFVAVLLLPTPSRTAVYNADHAAAERLGTAAVLAALPPLDRWQDDEPVRSPGVEFIFHPVPSRVNREHALQRSDREVFGGAHQLTRLTLFTGLATLSVLGRAVHCNIGRPALWALYPGD